MAIIDRICEQRGFDDAQWWVAKRLVHTTGDPGIVSHLRFSADWLSAGAAALRAGASITSDARMVKSGISVPRLQRLHAGYTSERLHCHVDDPAVVAAAQASRLPRSLYAVRAMRSVLPGAICCFGNAPVGLMELSRLVVEEGLRPALIVAMPVGFVHVVESKEEAMTLGIPFIAVTGRRGGSPLAVATLHALCLAAENATPCDTH